MTSKLDPQRKARDHRRNDKERKKRKRHHEKPTTPLHVDATSIVFASQQPDAESRYIVLEVLPDMTEEWIEKIVFLRSPTTGTPDRSFLGIQNLDDSLVWIELSLTAPSPAGVDPPPVVSGAVTFQRNLYSYGTTGATTRLLGLAKEPAANRLWASEPVFHRVGAINLSTGARDLSATTSQWCAGLDFDVVTGNMSVADGNESGSTTSKIKRFVGTTLAETWGGSTFGTGALNGIAYSEDTLNLYVCDDTANLLRRIRLSDKVQINTLALTRPYGVDVDASGNVYVSDMSANSVQRRNNTLATQAWIANTAGSGNGQLNAPGGVALDGSGRLWVVDLGNDRVQAFRASDGTYLGQFGTTGTGDGQFTQASGIACTGDLIYVSDAMTSGIHARISEWIVASDFPV